MWSRNADNIIRQAVAKGEFDDLPNKGQPLNLDEYFAVPEELRLSYKVLKNANVLPEEMESFKELLSLSDLLALAKSDEDRRSRREELNDKLLRFQQLMERRRPGTDLGHYLEAIRARLQN